MGRNRKVYTAGQKFHRLTLLKELPNDIHHNQMWRVQCDCGKRKTVVISAVQRGSTRSCGCLRDEKAGRKPTPWLEKGMVLNRGFVSDSHLMLPPPIKLKNIEANKDTKCVFCGRDGFSQNNIFHYQLFSGENEINMCYGCTLTVSHLLWLEFFRREYKGIVKKG